MSLSLTSPYRLEDADTVTDHSGGQYILRVKDLPEEEKPREKMLQLGPKHLTTAELLAVVWGVGTKREELLAMVQRTIKGYGEKAITHEQNAEHLAEVAGIPISKACQLLASLELGRRFYANKDGKPVYIHNAKQAYAHLRQIGYSQKEQLRALYLNSRYQLIHDEVVSVGSLTSNVIHPREVFQPALEHRAVAIIIAHNHPSGSTEPTQADITATRQLVSAGKVLGIELLDHLIITADKHVSILECL